MVIHSTRSTARPSNVWNHREGHPAGVLEPIAPSVVFLHRVFLSCVRVCARVRGFPCLVSMHSASFAHTHAHTGLSFWLCFLSFDLRLDLGHQVAGLPGRDA